MPIAKEKARCPEHNMTDCSPLLNGCSALVNMNVATGEDGPPRRMAVTHELKCDHFVFNEIWQRIKTFEIRKEIRGEREFHVGDVIRLREYALGEDDGIFYGAMIDPGFRGYSGRYVDVEVTYILDADSSGRYGLLPGHVAMAISLLDGERW